MDLKKPKTLDEIDKMFYMSMYSENNTDEYENYSPKGKVLFVTGLIFLILGCLLMIICLVLLYAPLPDNIDIIKKAIDFFAAKQALILTVSGGLLITGIILFSVSLIVKKVSSHR